jgi:hypothetical protein
MCTRGGLCEQGVVDDMALLSCYLAAIIHDYEHKGVNNDYLVRGLGGYLLWERGSGCYRWGAASASEGGDLHSSQSRPLLGCWALAVCSSWAGLGWGGLGASCPQA